MPGERFAWRDSGWLFGLGAALLSFPVNALLMAEQRSYGNESYGALIWMAAASGSAGMLLAGRIAYEKTRPSGPLVERAALITGTMFGMAFLIASVPFLYFAGMGMITAWIGGPMLAGLPIFALIVVWSLIFLVTAGPVDDGTPRRSIRRAAHRSVLWHVGWGVLSMLTLVVAIAGTGPDAPPRF